MNIEYIGEQLLPGKIGHLLIILSFVASLSSALCYWYATRRATEKDSWINLGRLFFRVHSIGILGIILILFYLILNHRFEYYYVWQHSSKALPIRYMFSCFWEGQEGSFLLWAFWQSVLGNILIKTAREWESHTLSVFSIVQAFLLSMLLGIYVLDYKIGSNPFVLLREHPDMAHLPFVKVATYLQSIDGRGLNPLLQNYWMTIHPPTLFLGFALTLVPFCYAIAGLWTKRYGDWVKPAIPWTFFGIMILGTGILMGGAWAYEALSFGGFWAWDPVENASLVPWLTMVGAAHIMVIYKNKGQGLFSSFIFAIITFILILYSTFLTRSGILGDSSVHAFTDLGMSGQLLIYLSFFALLSIFLLIRNYKNITAQIADDDLWSREFWMFIGALVLLLSSFQITFTTSIPVINKIFGSNLAPPLKPIEHYNSWQLPFAIVIALLIAIGQFLKYKKTNPKEFWKKITLSLSVSVAFSVVAIIALELYHIYYGLLLFASSFAVAANLDFFIRVLKGRVKNAGASIAHVGFGLILLGALISTSKSKTISQNTSGIDIAKLGEDFQNNENIMLMKDDTLRMGNYFVSYKGKKKEGVNIYFEILYFTKDEHNKYNYEFTLLPVVQTNPRMGNVAEPDTRHFLNRDIYTHVTYADLEMLQENSNEYKEAIKNTITVGDTIFSSNSLIILEGLNRQPVLPGDSLRKDDIAVGAKLKVIEMNGEQHVAEPVYLIRNNFEAPVAAEIDELGLRFLFSKINPQENKVDISVAEKKSNSREFIILKAVIFPFINVLWLGCILMIVGTVIAVRSRIRGY